MTRRLAAMLLFVPAFARAAVDTGGGEGEGETKVRASRPAADGASVSTLDPAVFRAELRHAGELAALAPGVVPLDFGGLLSTSTLTIRGGSADQVQVLFDGVPLNAAAGGGFDLSRIPGALVESLQVRRGAGGLESGAGAMTGTVRLEPVRSTRFVLTGGSFLTLGASGSTSGEWSDAGGLTKATVAIDARRSSGDFGYHRDPTPELSGNDAVEAHVRTNNDALLGSLLGKVERRTGEHSSMDALVLVSGANRGLPGPVSSPTPDARQADLSGIGQARWRTGRAGWDLEAPLMLRGSLLSANAGGLGEIESRQSLVDVGAMPRLTFDLDGVRLGVRALAGIESFRGPLHGDHARVRFGGAVEAERPVGRWTWSAGVRADRWGDATGIVPRAGGSVRLGSLTIFGNASGGFRPPSFGELYFSGGPVVPNPDLLPERSWTGDVGVRRDVGDLQLSLSSFVARLSDVIVYELYTGFRARPYNVGEAGSFGAEAEVRDTLDVGPGKLALLLSGTLLRTLNLVEGPNSLGKDLPYRPRLRGAARVDWTSDRLKLAAEIQATDGAFTNRANTRTLPGYADVRGSAGVSLGGGFWIGLEIRNALDVTDRAGIDGYPLPGRTLLGNLVWDGGR